jgi:hypothetical protein
MTSKGHSPVDLVSAEPATSRRSLIGAFGVAGLASAAAVAVARPVSAAPTDTEAPDTTSDTESSVPTDTGASAVQSETEAPNAPTAADAASLEQAMRLELAAKRLYRDAAAALSDETAIAVAQVGEKNHEASADRFAASTGVSADRYDETFYGDNTAAFSSGDVAEFAEAAWTLENNLTATYTELFGDFESIESRKTVASMVVVNARMATVMTDLAGVFDDLDAVFEPPSEPIAFNEVPR